MFDLYWKVGFRKTFCVFDSVMISGIALKWSISSWLIKMAEIFSIPEYLRNGLTIELPMSDFESEPASKMKLFFGVCSIIDWPAPTSRHERISFLGFLFCQVFMVSVNMMAILRRGKNVLRAL